MNPSCPRKGFASLWPAGGAPREMEWLTLGSSALQKGRLPLFLDDKGDSTTLRLTANGFSQGGGWGSEWAPGHAKSSCLLVEPESGSKGCMAVKPRVGKGKPPLCFIRIQQMFTAPVCDVPVRHRSKRGGRCRTLHGHHLHPSSRVLVEENRSRRNCN